mmetsp:Transcript_110445/g.352121  ORF Transcript_110445/g.352121 Transcript_110445/m.352121 type:complete len:473 (+) Transcript_110445:1160-2578(+)
MTKRLPRQLRSGIAARGRLRRQEASHVCGRPKRGMPSQVRRRGAVRRAVRQEPLDEVLKQRQCAEQLHVDRIVMADVAAHSRCIVQAAVGVSSGQQVEGYDPQLPSVHSEVIQVRRAGSALSGCGAHGVLDLCGQPHGRRLALGARPPAAGQPRQDPDLADEVAEAEAAVGLHLDGARGDAEVGDAVGVKLLHFLHQLPDPGRGLVHQRPALGDAALGEAAGAAQSSKAPRQPVQVPGHGEAHCGHRPVQLEPPCGLAAEVPARQPLSHLLEDNLGLCVLGPASRNEPHTALRLFIRAFSLQQALQEMARQVAPGAIFGFARLRCERHLETGIDAPPFRIIVLQRQLCPLTRLRRCLCPCVGGRRRRRLGNRGCVRAVLSPAAGAQLRSVVREGAVVAAARLRSMASLRLVHRGVVQPLVRRMCRATNSAMVAAAGRLCGTELWRVAVLRRISADPGSVVRVLAPVAKRAGA